MALTECPDCKNKVSSFALHCPGCGCPIKPAAITQAHEQFVYVNDFQMSFGNMVIFMIKWAIAVIPALFILAVIGLVFFGVIYDSFVRS